MALRTHILTREQRLDGTPEEVFGFFADAKNLEAITPPLLRFSVVTPTPIEMQVGALIEYRLRVHGAPVSWLTSIQAWEPPHRFVDMQLKGPYALWHHTHSFAPDGDTHTLMTDTVRYATGFGLLGELALRLFVRRDVERIFAHRAKVIGPLLAADIVARAARG
ncbi:MAG: SRPBCC family protein [Solirubrobacterales bacterium]|nr:SRPBCC family protein [Solirubrobacterales bacterium]